MSGRWRASPPTPSTCSRRSTGPLSAGSPACSSRPGSGVSWPRAFSASRRSRGSTTTSAPRARRAGVWARATSHCSAASWAREQAYDLFHLGGGVGGRTDSLYEFKRRFDPGGEREFAVGKAVHDEVAYRELAGEASPEGFLPAYRAPR